MSELERALETRARSAPIHLKEDLLDSVEEIRHYAALTRSVVSDLEDTVGELLALDRKSH